MAGLCTLANVKLALFPTGYTDTTDDVTLQLYVDAITSEVQEYTSRQFVTDASASDYYFDIAYPCRTLYVPQGVQSVTSLGYATNRLSQPASGGTYTTVTAANVLLRPLAKDRRGAAWPADTIQISDLETTFSGFPTGFNTVKVNGVFGFATVPADIERIAVANVIRRWQARRGGQSDTIGPSDFGGEAMRFMAPDERRTLDRYADPSVG